MAASPHSQETVSWLFERNYVPVLWHLMRKYMSRLGLNSGAFVTVLRLVAHQELLYGVCTGIIRTA
jgi:hypothetical protein